jgi:4-hydroxybenzoate polyprenyltransferase
MSSPLQRRAGVYLQLGRVSNLPTVWSNVLAGIVLGGAALRVGPAIGLGLAASLYYVGGMFLNDAFDHRVDARQRPERPIPAGLIGAGEVYRIGFGLLGAGLVLLVVCAALGSGVRVTPTLGAGLALAASVVLYDAWHKNNALSPLIMGTCRLLVYVTAALATSDDVGLSLAAGGASLLAYLVGLTYVAKQEAQGSVRTWWPLALLGAPIGAAVFVAGPAIVARPVALVLAAVFVAWVVRAIVILRARREGCVPRAVITLIAGISLVDALLAASVGQNLVALIAAAALPATLVLQRWVRGT